MLVAFNPFVRRQTPDSPYSHFEGEDEELLRLIEINFDQARPSYRKGENGEDVEMSGVLLVSVPPQGFYTGVVELQGGDELIGSYSPRVEGEEPRKHIYKKRKDGEGKVPAKYVDVVLYSHDVLAEDDDAATDAEYEIISINARSTKEELPIHPMTLIANHFHMDGGTKTNMTPEQFEKALRESVLYWKDKILLEGCR